MWKAATKYPDGYVQHWASLDGELWLPVNQAPTAADEGDLRELLKGTPPADGKPGKMYMRWATRALTFGAELVTPPEKLQS